MICEPFVTPEFFEKIAHHVGPKPWQYRILTAAAANALSQLRVPFIHSLFGWAKVLELLFLFLFILAFRRYLSLLIKDRAVCSLLSFLIFFVLPFHIFFPRPYYANYWYDTPSLFFFTLGLTLMYEKKWLLYYALFFTATWNRETTCFLTAIYLFVSLGKAKPAEIARHFTAQLVIWLAIKIFLAKLYLHNPRADVFEWYDRPGVTHFADNIDFFMRPKNYPAFFSNMGFLWMPVVFYYGRIKNDFVQRALWVAFPFFIGMMFVANIYELRIFQELIPLFLTAFCLILVDLIRKPV